MPWDIVYRNGLHLPQVGWWLDAHFRADRSFVSHAHFDHLAERRETLCSEGTARLMRTRLPGERIEHILPFGHPEQLTAQPSRRHEGGFARRFPRLARIRSDKTPAGIDTLETCRRLAGITPAAAPA